MSKKGMSAIFIVSLVIVIAVLVLANRAPRASDESAAGGTVPAGSLEPVGAADEPITTDTTSKKMEPQTTTTATGLKITMLAQGTGDAAKAGDTVFVNYTGMLESGVTFDSNVDPKFGHVQPFSFKLGSNMVIQGWEQGVLGMKVGEKRKLVIPASLGYGAQGAGNVIPPNATLIFEVEVTSIKK